MTAAPGCLLREVVHDPHELSSPGGAKPGARCPGKRPDATGIPSEWPVIVQDGPLGHRTQAERGWNGYSGTVPYLGPVEEPCRSCSLPSRRHPVRDLECWSFLGWEELQARESATVDADVTTSWVCHGCGHDCSVSGEGAVYSWMECTCGEHLDRLGELGAGCGASSYLVM